jgi:hypothetical protein
MRTADKEQRQGGAGVSDAADGRAGAGWCGDEQQQAAGGDCDGGCSRRQARRLESLVRDLT